jgi:hypothetical protein
MREGCARTAAMCRIARDRTEGLSIGPIEKHLAGVVDHQSALAFQRLLRDMDESWPRRGDELEWEIARVVTL